MKPQFRELRLKQLARALGVFAQARTVPRPKRGWLRAIREATGTSLGQVATGMGISQQSVAFLEKSEASDRITLKSLRAVARALGCELVYAIVPQSGNINDLAVERARSRVAKHVLAVEHTMALENQAPGNVQEKIEEETRRLLKR